MHTRLSVNLNKVALVRNGRGEGFPDIVEAARVAIEAGCGGLTLHPREDRRHALLEDVEAFSALPEVVSGEIELNVEGDLRQEVIDAVHAYHVHQFTIVPVEPGEVTTHRGLKERDDLAALSEVIDALPRRCRASVFVDPEPEALKLAKTAGAHAIEFHTKAYAAAVGTKAESSELSKLREMAEEARRLDLLVNAGHDLDRENLPKLLAAVQPHEVSIGHALVSAAIFEGLAKVVADYVRIVEEYGTL